MNPPQYALIGQGIANSLSQIIHTANFKARSSLAQYSLLETTPEGMSTVRNLGLSGFNVTAPYKERFLELADYVDPVARKIGAINTIALRQGKWHATNTDGLGFMKGLTPFMNHAGSSALVIGAGGAARSIAYELKSTFPRVDITNRTYEKAERVRDALNLNAAKTIIEAERTLASYDLIVNTTRETQANSLPLRLDNLQPDTHVVDIATHRTAFMRAASLRPNNVQDGTNMLVWQAVYAYAFWTGKEANVGAIFAALRRRI